MKDMTLLKSGSLPKVGIRPVIDARLDGIRESLEYGQKRCEVDWLGTEVFQW